VVALLGVIALIAGAVAAVADELVYDGDTVAVGVQTTVDLGTVSPGDTINHTIGLSLICDTKKHADRGTTVTVSKGPASSVPSGGSLTMASVVFTIPNDWPQDGTDCSSPPQRLDATQAVTIGAPTTPGSYTYVLALAKTVSAGTPGDVKDPNPAKLTFTLTVQAAANQAPVVDAGGPYSGNEGSPITLSGSASDPDGPGPLSYLWTIESSSVGSGSCSLANATSLTSATITCTDDGTATVRLTATEAGPGSSGSDTAEVTISNVAPTADDLSATSPIQEGGNSSLSLTNPTDASSVDAASLRYSFACDGLDGSLAPNYAAAGTTNSATCSFADNGTFTVKGRVYDKDGGGTTYSATVVVNNVPPTVSIESLNNKVDCRSNAKLVFSFTDPGVNDGPWSVEIDWDDGNTDSSTATSQGVQGSVSHAYTTPGDYTVTVKVTDKDGDSGTATANITVEQVYTVDFLPPFDDSSPSGLIINKMKNGRVVPVKATIYDVCAQAYVIDPTTQVTIKVSKTSGTGNGDPVEEYADAGQSSAGTNLFRWTTDSTVPGGGFWIYNLDSKALGLVVNNLYRIDINVGANLATRDTWAVLQPVK
jgi:hypothetical protein